MANETQVGQHMVQVAHNGEESQALCAQHMVQVLVESPIGFRFTETICTDLASKETLLRTNEEELSWAVLDSDDGSEVTSILDQNNTLNIVDGEGFIQAEDVVLGTDYIVVLQNGTGSIGAYVMTAGR